MSPGLVEKVLLGVLAGFPLFFGGLGCLIAGILARRLVRVLGSTARVRRVVAVFGLVLAGIMIVLSSRLQSPTLAMLAMGAASFANDLVMPGAWGACMDVGGKYAGSLVGQHEHDGQLWRHVRSHDRALHPEIQRRRLERRLLGVRRGVLGGALAWCFIDPVTPLDSRRTIAVATRDAERLDARESEVTVRDVACTICGCVCDDLAVTVRDKRIVGVQPGCPLAEPWFLSLGRLRRPGPRPWHAGAAGRGARPPRTCCGNRVRR